jgi:hypothetical protein
LLQVSTTLADLVAKFAAGVVVDTGGNTARRISVYLHLAEIEFP